MRYLVIGGTGSLGREVIRELLQSPENRVCCFSRDELKQQELKREWAGNENLTFRLGDIRDKRAVQAATVAQDTVFHLAALKHIDVVEENPEEAVWTNVVGTIHVADAAVANQVPYCVFSSTDKAVDPINAYGMTKGLSEKILMRRNEIQFDTRFSVFRWGNVWASRGSVIHFFAKTLKEEKRVYLTHTDMSRFWISLPDAARFMIRQYSSAPLNRACIPPIKAARVSRVISAIVNVLDIDQFQVITTGIRRGEKIHEVLTSQHSPNSCSSETWNQYTKEELTELVRSALEASP